MLNTVSLQGRLTRTPEIRYAGETPVANFALAVDRNYKDKDGNYGVDFINCVAFKHTANFVKNYFDKGSMAIVTGRIQSRSYQTKDGQPRTAVEVVCDSVYFCGGKNTNQSENAATGGYNRPSEPQQAYAEIFDDDAQLPF